MTPFSPKNFAGQTYTFEHLAPITVFEDFGGKPVRITYRFGCHCFTEDFDNARHTPGHAYVHEHETRAFNPQRYKLSLQLPEILKTQIARGMIYKSKHNYTYISQVALDVGGGRKVDYPIFFSIEKDTTIQHPGVVIFIVSAYLVDLKLENNERNRRFKSLVAHYAEINDVVEPKPRPMKKVREKK